LRDRGGWEKEREYEKCFDGKNRKRMPINCGIVVVVEKML